MSPDGDWVLEIVDYGVGGYGLGVDVYGGHVGSSKGLFPVRGKGVGVTGTLQRRR